METAKVPLPEAWTGDLTETYTKRYLSYFPGEPETKGFTAPKLAWGGKRG